VVCTYYDYTGIDEDTLKNVGNAFAAGMGNMEGTLLYRIIRRLHQ
jgi:hypothetical protein